LSNANWCVGVICTERIIALDKKGKERMKITESHGAIGNKRGT